MPIEKLSSRAKIHTDLRSSTFDNQFNNKICCYLCKETVFTLRRARDESGVKIKPARYVCSHCGGK